VQSARASPSAACPFPPSHGAAAPIALFVVACSHSGRVCRTRVAHTPRGPHGRNKDTGALFAASIGAVAAALASPATAALHDEDDPLGSGHGAAGVGELDEQVGAGVLRAWAEEHCHLCRDADLTPNSVVASIVSSSRSTLYAALARTKEFSAGSAVPHIGVAHCPERRQWRRSSTAWPTPAPAAGASP
jgi:hypothetical protein